MHERLILFLLYEISTKVLYMFQVNVVRKRKAQISLHSCACSSDLSLFGTRDLFNISYSRELYLFSKFLHFEEIVRVKMAVCCEMIVSET